MIVSGKDWPAWKWLLNWRVWESLAQAISHFIDLKFTNYAFLELTLSNPLHVLLHDKFIDAGGKPVFSPLYVYAFNSSFKFDKVQSEADSLWRYNYYAVVYEHFDRPRFPIFEALIRLMVNCLRNCIGDNYSEFSMYCVVAKLYLSGRILPAPNNRRFS